MKLHCVLLSIALGCCCSAAGDHPDNLPAAMTTGTAHSDADPPGQNGGAPPPGLPEPAWDQEAPWRKEVLDLLAQLVRVQKDIASGQAQVVHLLGMLGTQGSQQIQDLQNMARHQSLLVENHQALLLQTSRIATELQEITKKPAAAPSQ